MLLRIGATILLALLFARPVSRGIDADENSSESTVILLDASGSISDEMADDVRDAAAKAIKEGRAEGGTVTVAEFSDQVKTLDSLNDFHPQQGAPTRLDAALNWALDRLLETGAPDSGKLVLIGHFANSALPEVPPRVWPIGIEIELIPILPKHPVNSAVTHVELRTPYKTEKMEIEARLLLPPDVPAKVTIKAEGFVEEQSVKAGSERVLFQFRPSRDQVRGWIELKSEGDAWPWDDRRPFVFQWTDRSRVLLIDGSPGGTPFEGDAYFLEKALEASGAEHGLSPFAPEISYGLKNRQGLTNLSQYDAVALCGVGEVSAAEAKLLKSYVDSGGGLLVVLGNGWGPALYSSLVSVGLFPERSADNGGKAERRISKWDETHHALSPFGAADGGDLRSLSWRDCYEVQADENWKSLAELDGGKPILLGKNRVLVCPHPLNRDWTNLPQEPIFVPMVKSLFSFLSNVGEPPKLSEVMHPGVNEHREAGWYVMPDETSQVVVADPSDSNVAAAELREVASSLGLPLSAIGEKAESNWERERAQVSEMFKPRPRELWPWIALLLLAWFVFEGILATAPRLTR